MAWIDTVPDLCRTFKTPQYREDRQRQAGNFGGMAYEYSWKVFGKYGSHILYPEMLFSFRLDRRNLHFVEAYVERNIYTASLGQLKVDVTEIMNYRSALVYDHAGTRENINSTKRLIEVEKAVRMGEGKLYLKAEFAANSRFYTSSRQMHDPDAPVWVNLSDVNLPPLGSSFGPYPNAKALFWEARDAAAYRDFLIKQVYDNPQALVYMGNEHFTFSPAFFNETPTP